MEKEFSKLRYFMIVLIPYVILFIYTAYIYFQLQGELPGNMPKILLWLPVFTSAILPITYGALIFALPEYLKKTYAVIVAVFMAMALFGLIGLLVLITFLTD